MLPFSAIVGQQRLKTALMMIGTDPSLKGLLIRGERGTAKSTAARALAHLLPDVQVIEACRFGCQVEAVQDWCPECRDRKEGVSAPQRPPFETLPLGITEDQLLGAIDLEAALQKGQKRFAPGLLARVNGGLLYVDEVNLLEDHLVDLLLDVAAAGINVVEREGISISHPSRFGLIGTMNPEEGDLRPQLLDRFGLCVDIEAVGDLEERAEIVSRRLAFERSPDPFVSDWAEEERQLTDRIERARTVLPDIDLDRNCCLLAAEIALEFEVDGHRADILIVKGAAALAALDGRSAIEQGDLSQAAALVLPHRLRRRPFEDRHLSGDAIQEQAEEVLSQSKKKALS